MKFDVKIWTGHGSKLESGVEWMKGEVRGGYYIRGYRLYHDFYQYIPARHVRCIDS